MEGRFRGRSMLFVSSLGKREFWIGSVGRFLWGRYFYNVYVKLLVI